MEGFQALGHRPCSDSAEAARVSFREDYINRFLPALNSIHQQGYGSTIYDRLMAVKFAADMSLAMTANGVNWSRALGRKLCQQMEEHEHHVHGTCLESEKQSDAPTSEATAKWNGRGSDPKTPRMSSTCSMQASMNTRAKQQQLSNMGRTIASTTDLHRKDEVLAARISTRRTWIRKRQGKRAWKREYKKALQLERERTSTVQIVGGLGESKIKKLGKIIPGGSDMDASMLLEEAADYIQSLQMQVEALESLAQAV